MSVPLTNSGSEAPTTRTSKQSYYLPTGGATETHRLDSQHEIIKIYFNGNLFLAPIVPTAVLDIGCGTSIWPIEVARQFPSAEVVGIDAGGQTQHPNPPSNYTYTVGNFDHDWSFKDQQFDLIHGRLILAFTAGYRKLISQIYSHLKPGGWFEIQDLNFPWRCTGTGAKWNDLFMEASSKLGIDNQAVGNFDAWMAEEGFVNIEHRVFLMPVGPWAKDKKQKRVGQLVRQSFYDGMEGLTRTKFTKVLGWSDEEINEIVEQVREEMMRDDTRWFWHMDVVYGQKPGITEQGE